ncbi:MAG: L-2-keto-3-deoxyarabonate dehydratase [uncultured Thermomicrobiales bacterium]|uniref:L-2-keto-3-deoxyarabonate dehydratase n=1 Tax=uncultured Thermomicrobiales bacterium TaxID=1645740 RepID=A0A6J4UNZ5_9BACT|nr:MAG: L-2-keto-3-deoxyarabonate dehydratase [uncultured Thermomicrobiales bacterium]
MDEQTLLRGVIPIAPTIFNDDESLDLEGQRRSLDFLIDAGVDAICILANYSEQFSLSDQERDELLALALDHVAGRVPVIVTTSHYSARIAAERSRRAQDAGAAMVMLMPPYHGATLRVGGSDLLRFFGTVAEAIAIPIMIQDAPMSGTPLPSPLLAELAQAIPLVRYAKIESANAASAIRTLIALAGDALPGPFDGEEGITLIPDLEAGAVGTMPSAMIPDILGEVVRRWHAGDRPSATDLWEAWLPMIHFENRQCGLRATKVLMKEGGIIRSAATRAPFGPLAPAIEEGLIAHARRRDPLILRWAAAH